MRVQARVHSEGVCWCRDVFVLDFVVIDPKNLACLWNAFRKVLRLCLAVCLGAFLHAYCRCLFMWCVCVCVRASHLLSLCLPGSRLIRLWWVGVPGPVAVGRNCLSLSVSARVCVRACANAGGHQVAPAGLSEISVLRDSNEEYEAVRMSGRFKPPPDLQPSLLNEQYPVDKLLWCLWSCTT